MAVADEVSVELEAKVSQYLSDVKRAADRFESDMERMNRAAGGAERQAQQAFTGIRTAALSLAGAFSVKEVLAYADAWTGVKNSLANAGITGVQQSAVLEQLYQSAQKNSVPLKAMVDLYGKVAQAQTSLGASTLDMLKFTDNVGKALQIAGTNSTTASGALLQLSQALGSGTVRAEEFNSVMEGARPILQGVANGLPQINGDLAKLRELVVSGGLSSKDFFEAFNLGFPSVAAKAGETATTISQAMTKIQNAFTKYIGETDSSLGATARLSAGLSALADNFNKVADVTLKLVGVIAAGMIGRALAPMIASLGIGVAALARFAASLTAAVTAAAGIGALIRGAATAFAGLAAAAGPVGFVIAGALAAAVITYTTAVNNASTGSDVWVAALKRVDEQARQTAQTVADGAEQMNNTMREKLREGARVGTEEVQRLRQQLDVLLTNITIGDASWSIPDKVKNQIQDIIVQFNRGTISAKEAADQIRRIGDEDKSVRYVTNAFLDLLGPIERARQALAGISSELRAVGAAARQVQTIQGQLDAFGAAGRTTTPGLPPELTATQDQIANGAFLRNSQQRQEALNRESSETRRLREEMDKLRTDANFTGATDAQLRAIAQGRIAADDRRSEEDKSGRSGSGSRRATADDRFARDMQDYRDRIAMMQLEIQVTGQSTQEQDRRRMALELEQRALRDAREEARRKGQTDLSNITISAEQRSQIEAVSRAYAEQAQALRVVQETQQRAQQAASEFYDTFKSSMVGAITGARSLADALSNILKKLAELLLNSAFDALFKPAGGGGIFGTLTSAFGGAGSLFGGGGSEYIPSSAFKAAGGPVEAGRPYVVGEKGPEVLVPGRSGNIIPSLPDFVGMLTGKSGGESFTFAPMIDARGADSAAVARIEAIIAQIQAEFYSRVNASIRDQQKRRLLR